MSLKNSPTSIDDYVAHLPETAAAFVTEIRQAISAHAPLATEHVKYDMPVFHVNGRYIFYVGAWKHHVGIYPITRNYPFEADIAPYRSGKDTVKFLYKDELPLDVIRRIIAARAAELMP
jgi:uncharacterized protein YdhG (YjbR/CyaY superfamily)